MKSSTLLLTVILCGFTSLASAAGWNGLIMDVRARVAILQNRLYQDLSRVQNIVLADTHYDVNTQSRQARVIRGVVASGERANRFAFAWEFLNRSNDADTQRELARLRSGEITAVEFLNRTQGSENARIYEPVIEAVRELGGDIVSTNLSSEEKRPAVQGGLAAMPAAHVPPRFQVGSEVYYQRFTAAMGDHGSEAYRNYFVAQSLVDSWMAHSMLNDTTQPLRFLIAGNFHTDYGLGVVAELARLGRRDSTKVVRFVDASEYTERELWQFLTHPRLGPVADYAWVFNEPKT